MGNNILKRLISFFRRKNDTILIGSQEIQKKLGIVLKTKLGLVPRTELADTDLVTETIAFVSDFKYCFKLEKAITISVPKHRLNHFESHVKELIQQSFYSNLNFEVESEIDRLLKAHYFMVIVNDDNLSEFKCYSDDGKDFYFDDAHKVKVLMKSI